MKNLTEKNHQRFGLKKTALLFTALISVFCCAVSCGKKGPPTLKAYAKPAAPSNLTAIHRENSIILTWSHDKKGNLKGYRILRSTDTGLKQIAFVEKDKDNYTDTDFKTNVSYTYAVAAETMKDVVSDTSNIIAVTPLPAPTAPRNISKNVTANSVILKWEDANEAVLYNIYKRDVKGSYGMQPINTSPVQQKSFVDSIEMNSIVYYTVRAALNKDSRDEGPASDEISVNPAEFTPSRPKGLKAVAASDKIVILWAENPEIWVKKYRVYRRVSSNGEFILIGEPITPVFTDIEKKWTKQTYRVTAVGPQMESQPSDTVTVE